MSGPPKGKNINEDREWSKMDIFDLKNALILGRPVSDVATDVLAAGVDRRRRVPQQSAASYP